MAKFETEFEDLPEALGVFPLSGLLLLPRCVISLNLFEARYLALFEWAICNHRLMAIGQPKQPVGNDPDPALYDTITAARIVGFEETPEQHILVHLKGICRGKIGDELPLQDGFRRFKIDWSDFADDLTSTGRPFLERDDFFAMLRRFFTNHKIETDWDALQAAPDERLVAMLAMTIDFGPVEKQALLEADDWPKRAAILSALMEMSINHDQDGKNFMQ
ncbi:MAG: LON peptidase substrate-binding domain-containing protein [Pseudomonadota bacterium]